MELQRNACLSRKPLDDRDFGILALLFGFRDASECRDFADEQQAKADYRDYRQRIVMGDNDIATSA